MEIDSEPDAKKDAINCIVQKKKNQLKSAVRTLIEISDARKMSDNEYVQVVDAFSTWMSDEKVDGCIVTVAKAFYNWMDKIEVSSKELKAKFSNAVIALVQCPEMLMDLEKQKVTKRLMTLAAAKITVASFVAYWSSSLITNKAKIDSEIVSSKKTGQRKGPQLTNKHGKGL